MECSDIKGALKMSKNRDQTNGTPIFVIHYRTFSLTKVNILCNQEIIQRELSKYILKWSPYWSAFSLIVMQFCITASVYNVYYNVDNIQLLICSFLNYVNCDPLFYHCYFWNLSHGLSRQQLILSPTSEGEHMVQRAKTGDT